MGKDAPAPNVTGDSPEREYSSQVWYKLVQKPFLSLLRYLLNVNRPR